MNKAAMTVGDLAGAGELEGRHVRFLGRDVPALVPPGTIGVVRDVSPSEPKALVNYKFPERRGPWRIVHLESRLRELELAEPTEELDRLRWDDGIAREVLGAVAMAKALKWSRPMPEHGSHVVIGGELWKVTATGSTNRRTVDHEEFEPYFNARRESDQRHESFYLDDPCWTPAT